MELQSALEEAEGALEQEENKVLRIQLEQEIFVGIHFSLAILLSIDIIFGCPAAL